MRQYVLMIDDRDAAKFAEMFPKIQLLEVVGMNTNAGKYQMLATPIRAQLACDKTDDAVVSDSNT